MEFRFGLSIAVLLVAVVTRGHAELQCYVCDNCAKIDKTTPLETCGPVASTTVTIPTETSTVTTTTTTTAPTTTEEHTTEEQTTKSTAFPTPPTVGPTSTTTGLPTPPNVGTLPAEVFEIAVNHTPAVNSTSQQTTPPVYFVTPSHEGGSTTVEPTITVTPMHNHTSENHNTTSPSTVLLRQRRNIPVNGMTYHCYKVQKKYNGVYGVERGCMGVLTEQSVCGQLKAANNNQTMKCQPCSTTMCNSSSTLGVSIASLLVALVALVYRV